MQNPPPLVIRNLELWHPGGTRPAIVKVNITLQPGTVTVLIGASGAGKSSLFSAILNELTYAKGSIEIAGQRVSKERPVDPRLFSFVPQHDNLRPDLTVEQTLKLAAEARSTRRETPAQRDVVYQGILNQLDMKSFEGRRISKISGGERRRVSIALELFSSPRLLLLDEPTTGLDVETARHVMDLLRAIANGPNQPAILLVSHDLVKTDLSKIDRVIALGKIDESADEREKTGRVRFDGPPDGLLPSLGITDLNDVDAALTRMPRSRVAIPKERPTVSRNFPIVSVSWARSLRYYWKLQLINLSHMQWLYQFFLVWAFGLILAGLLKVISNLGIGSSTEFVNFKFMSYVGFLIVILTFMCAALPISELVKSWQYVRREQRWGLAASASVCAMSLIFFVHIIVAVVTTAFFALMFSERPTSDTLLASIISHDPFPQLVVLALLAALQAYSIGVLIGCTNTNQNTATLCMVGLFVAMLFLSGLFFAVPEFPPVYLGSFLLPARSGIAAIASNFRAVTAMGQVEDGAFDLALPNLYLVMIFVAVLTIATFFLALFALKIPLRSSPSEEETPFRQRAFDKLTSYKGTRWLRNSWAQAFILISMLISVTGFVASTNSRGEALLPGDGAVALASPGAHDGSTTPPTDNVVSSEETQPPAPSTATLVPTLPPTATLVPTLPPTATIPPTATVSPTATTAISPTDDPSAESIPPTIAPVGVTVTTDTQEAPTPTPTPTQVPTSTLAPIETQASVYDLLPSQSDVPTNLSLSEDGSRSLSDVANNYQNFNETVSLFTSWGWQGNAFRTYQLPEGVTAEPSQVQSVYVSVHQFGGPEQAIAALDYSLDNQVAGSAYTLTEVNIAPVGSYSRALYRATGTGNELTILAQQGNSMIRVTVTVAAPGDPTGIALDIIRPLIERAAAVGGDVTIAVGDQIPCDSPNNPISAALAAMPCHSRSGR